VTLTRKAPCPVRQSPDCKSKTSDFKEVRVEKKNVRQEVSLEDLQDPEILIFGVTHDLNFDL